MAWDAQRFIDDRVSADANVAEVTGGFFDVLGVQPVLGRALTLGDDKEWTENVIVLSMASGMVDTDYSQRLACTL